MPLAYPVHDIYAAGAFANMLQTSLAELATIETQIYHAIISGFETLSVQLASQNQSVLDAVSQSSANVIASVDGLKGVTADIKTVLESDIYPVLSSTQAVVDDIKDLLDTAGSITVKIDSSLADPVYVAGI